MPLKIAEVKEQTSQLVRVSLEWSAIISYETFLVAGQDCEEFCLQ